jgi:hypothetical protein
LIELSTRTRSLSFVYVFRKSCGIYVCESEGVEFMEVNDEIMSIQKLPKVDQYNKLN